MQKEPILVIMAAGMGSRFGGLKQIEPISGKDEIILDFSLYDAMMAGFKRAIIIIKKENEEAFHELIDNKAGKHMDISFAYQDIYDIPEGYKVPEGRVKPWGTAHAVLAARDLIDAPFAVINSDDYYGAGAFQTIYDFLLNAEDKEYYDYAMIGYQIENTLTENGFVSRGVCESKDGYLTSITERKKIKWYGDSIVFAVDNEETWHGIEKGTLVSMNFWGFTESYIREGLKRLPDFLNHIGDDPLKKEFLLPSTVDEQIKEGLCRVRVLESHDRWYGVTYKEDKESVVNALQSMKDKGLYPETLWK